MEQTGGEGGARRSRIPARGVLERRPQLIARLAFCARWLFPAGDRLWPAPGPAETAPRHPGAVTAPARPPARQQAPRQRHAAPLLKRYVEDHDHQVLDVVAYALRSARTRVAPAAQL